jgi:competence protein ComEC
MASQSAPIVPLGDDEAYAASQQSRRNPARLSSIARAADDALAGAGLDRGPWLAVAFGGGIAGWFVLPGPGWWIAAIVIALAVAGVARAAQSRADGLPHLSVALIALGVVFAAGLCVIWARSEMVGAAPLERPSVAVIDGRVLAREDRPAEDRFRLVLAMREPGRATASKVRVNVPLEDDRPGLREGARVRLKARLMPPSPPMLPGAYDFARAAWFQGLAATGSALSPPTVVEPAAEHGGTIVRIQRAISAHVRSQLGGSAGAIAAAFASGDRGAIATADEDAMRDAGLTHLLSISGLHVSAVIAGVYVLAIRLLALWSWLALRVRLPLVAAGCGAAAGIAYTLITGSEVPTVRSCVGAVLVLIALALGREALSMRMVAVAAIAVLVVWPESLAGPSFQMSFAAVVAIVSLHGAAPVRAFLAPREESWPARIGRHAVMLLVTGVVIEVALTPIVLFHFHRAGLYGALANVIAIPLVTFVSMPLIALALVLDAVGAGAPAWWLAGKSLDILLAIARFTASQPGAVKLMPQIGWGAFALFVAGGLWLALWHGRIRLGGLIPIALATAMVTATPVPDLLVSSDGHHVGIVGEGGRLLVLRDSRSEFARDNLLELAGMRGEPVPLATWPGARCSRDFCVVALERGGRAWRLLLARSRGRIEERALAAACARVDIVVAERWLPWSCRPSWLKADRTMLGTTGGLAIDLGSRRVTTVAQSQGRHPWWRPRLSR